MTILFRFLVILWIVMVTWGRVYYKLNLIYILAIWFVQVNFLTLDIIFKLADVIAPSQIFSLILSQIIFLFIERASFLLLVCIFRLPDRHWHVWSDNFNVCLNLNEFWWDISWSITTLC